jgi:NAD+ synthetase
MAPPLRLAIAQFQPRKGSYTANLARIRGLFAQVAALSPPPAVLCLPETALSGYFVEGGVEEVSVSTGRLAADLDLAWREASPGVGSLDVVVGFYERWEHTLHNSAAYLRVGRTPGGEVVHVHRKLFLPTYGIFDEHRFVEPGLDVRAFDVPWGRTAILVCEDAWHSLTAAIAALDGAQVVFVCSAAPARGIHPGENGSQAPASVNRWDRLIRDIAEEHGVYAVLCSLVGSEGGKSFQGGSLVVGPHGDVRARAPAMEEALLVAEIDLDDLARARADAPLLADLRAQLPNLERELARARANERAAPVRYDKQSAAPAATVAAETREVRRETGGGAAAGSLPVINAAPAAPPTLAIDGDLTERWLVGFIRDEFARRGFTDAVVALSGGVDSAVTTALAARALGADHVHAICMPYRTSHPDSLAHAQLVAKTIGVGARVVEISDAVDGYLRHEPDANATRRGNVMARARMIALFDQSAKLRALPLGTGNKTERLFGYFTWHADDSPPINPIGDLFKTQVWALARHLGLPDVVIDKPATADLVEGQTDEGDMGISYARADEILNLLLNGFPPGELVAHGFSAAEVRVVRGRLDSTHWKRRPPTVAMVSSTAIGEGYLRPVDY